MHTAISEDALQKPPTQGETTGGAVGIAVVAVMLGVSCTTIGFNISLSHIEAERKVYRSPPQ